MGVGDSHVRYIDRRRRELGVSVTRLAGLAGINPETTWHILNGRIGNIGTRTLDKLHDALKRAEAEQARRR